MLQILDIKKSFGDLHVLRGVDLDVEQGDVVAIIGIFDMDGPVRLR